MKRALLIVTLLILGVVGGVVVGNSLQKHSLLLVKPEISEQHALTVKLTKDGELIIEDGNKFAVKLPSNVNEIRIKWTDNFTKFLIEDSEGSVVYPLNASIEKSPRVSALRLSEEQERKAKQIALKDERVKALLRDKNYTVISVGSWIEVRTTEIGGTANLTIETLEGNLIGAVVVIKLDEKECFINVNLEKEKVISMNCIGG